MKVIVTFLAFLIGITTHAQKNYSYSVDKIWSNGNYCAFTSLVKYKGRFYCAFREGRGHIFDENGNAEGKIRIISSTDEKHGLRFYWSARKKWISAIPNYASHPTEDSCYQSEYPYTATKN